MAMDAKSGGIAVGVAVRRPLQPRDSNVVAAGSALAGKAHKEKAKVRARPGPAPAASPPSVKSYARGESGVEVSLAEELEKVRERRGRMRTARDLTERDLQEREEALRQEAREWERRGDEQRRLVAELMRLLGMPEVYTPVESLRSKEERKRKEGIAYSSSLGSTYTASTFQEHFGVHSCDQEFESTVKAGTTTATTETSS